MEQRVGVVYIGWSGAAPLIKGYRSRDLKEAREPVTWISRQEYSRTRTQQAQKPEDVNCELVWCVGGSAGSPVKLEPSEHGGG